MKSLYLKTLAIFFCILLSASLLSCDFDESKDSFVGGELLDEEKLSEIRDSFFTEETASEEKESESDTGEEPSDSPNSESELNSSDETESKNEAEGGTLESENNETDEDFTETKNEVGDGTSDSQKSEMGDSLTESETFNEDQLVYWTKSGSRWHLFLDCYHIKDSENIISGTVEEALEAKKEKLCSNCAKKAED